MFSPPVYLCVGDEYDKRTPRDNTNAGKAPFVVSAKRHPHVSESTFDPYVSLASGEPYQSTGFSGSSSEKKAKNADKMRDVQPFRPSGPSKRSCGKGDYYGTFADADKPKHETEFPPIKTLAQSSADAAAAKKNFVVNRPKKGTYGYTGLTIAQAGEVQYISDPYEDDVRKAALKRKYEAARCMGPPFRAAVKRGGCFDESPHGVSTVYNLTKPLPPKKAAPAPAMENSGKKPWVPGGALAAEASKYPEYQEDPYDLKERKVREARQKEQSYKAWVPAGNEPYRHIYTKPIDYNPPAVL